MGGVASTSSAPATTSMLKASGAHASVPVSIPIAPSPGGRTGFLTDPIQVSKHTLASTLAGLDEEGDTRVDKEIKQIAREVTRKHGPHPGEKCGHNGEEQSDGDGYLFKDLDAVADVPTTKKTVKAKSPAKSGPTMDKWTVMDLEAMRKDRLLGTCLKWWITVATA